MGHHVAKGVCFVGFAAKSERNAAVKALLMISDTAPCVDFPDKNIWEPAS